MKDKFQQLHEQLGQIVLDKSRETRLAITCLLANGHLLIEDVPGVGKTTLVQALAKLIGLEFSRIQFTSDLLPADIIGNNIFDTDQKKFRFHAGPLFGQLILADELNRANPKTQSALLQAMEEGQVSVDRETHNLPKPFILVATQNPHLQLGTHPLPESQLDRFLMSLELKPASSQIEMRLFQGLNPRQRVPELQPVMSAESLIQAQKEINDLTISEKLAQYISALVDFSRKRNPIGTTPLSTRAGMDLAKASRAWAWQEGRKMVLPEDVQAVWVSVTGHRMGSNEGVHRGINLAEQILNEVAVPN